MYFWFWIIVGLTYMWVGITGIMNATSENMRIKRNKYILIWTSPEVGPIKDLGKGQEAFYQKNCAHLNCYVTSNRTFFYDVSNFDMIIYHGPEILRYNMELPSTRLRYQIYVFASMESPTHYPSCNKNLNNFFNWTWTHKLQSEVYYGYLIIKDNHGNIIGPRENMNWIKVEDMEPIDEIIRAKLDVKHKAAAWFVSNCAARNNRRQVASDINEELEKYGLSLDVYGKCGWMSCEVESWNDCLKLIEDHYYFYLAFENSNSEDYITEKLLHGLKHYAVPVIYGGANYTRYMADCIYLNARTLEVEDLVKKMVYLINHKEEYYRYFRWHNHYSYHYPTESPETDPNCNLCAAINDVASIKHGVDYTHFDEWWNEPNACRKEEE